MNNIKDYLNSLYGKRVTSAYPEPSVTTTYKDKVSELPNDELNYIKNDVLCMVEFYADTDSVKKDK